MGLEMNLDNIILTRTVKKDLGAYHSRHYYQNIETKRLYCNYLGDKHNPDNKIYVCCSDGEPSHLIRPNFVVIVDGKIKKLSL